MTHNTILTFVQHEVHRDYFALVHNWLTDDNNGAHVKIVCSTLASERHVISVTMRSKSVPSRI